MICAATINSISFTNSVAIVTRTGHGVRAGVIGRRRGAKQVSDGANEFRGSRGDHISRVIGKATVSLTVFNKWCVNGSKCP